MLAGPFPFATPSSYGTSSPFQGFGLFFLYVFALAGLCPAEAEILFFSRPPLAIWLMRRSHARGASTEDERRTRPEFPFRDADISRRLSFCL
jgi:hypothetical protein